MNKEIKTSKRNESDKNNELPEINNNNKEFFFYLPNFIMFLICFSLVMIFFYVPATQPSDSIDLGDDGKVGISPDEDNREQIKEQVKGSFAQKIYNFGDSSCHQINRRSLFINGNEMPLCARDIGIYAGFAIGAIIVTFRKIEIRVWWVLGALIPIGVDGLTQLFTSYESNNPMRLITGGLAGIMTTMVLGIMFYELYITSRYYQKRQLLKAGYIIVPSKNKNSVGNDYSKVEEESGISGVGDNEILSGAEPGTETAEKNVHKKDKKQ